MSQKAFSFDEALLEKVREARFEEFKDAEFASFQALNYFEVLHPASHSWLATAIKEEGIDPGRVYVALQDELKRRLTCESK